MEPLDPDAFEPTADREGAGGPVGDPHAPVPPARPLPTGRKADAEDDGGGVSDVLVGAADLTSPVLNGLDLASGAVSAAGDVVASGAEVAGEVVSSAVEGLGAAAEGCGSCSLAVLVMLFAAVGTACAFVR